MKSFGARTRKAADFGLPSGTVIEELPDNQLVLVINRKSRIIMADGRKILDKAEKIRQIRPECQISLRTSAPVCSKTLVFLKKAGINTLPGSINPD